MGNPMPSSLLRFSDRVESAGQKLYWDRASVDNMPYRGHQAPIMTDDEFEARTIRVADARNAFFDVFDPQSNKQYLDVLECCFNGWFQLVHLERFWTDPEGRRSKYHYVEWVEYYIEDGTRTPFLSGGITELAHGQQNVGFHS